MAGLILPAWLTKQPQYRARLDRSNQLTALPAFVFLPNIEIVAGLPITPAGSTKPTVTAGAVGRGASFTSGTAATSYLDLGVPKGPTVDMARAPFTMFGVFTCGSTANVALFERNDSNATNIGFVFGASRNNQLGIEIENDTNFRRTISDAIVPGVNTLVVTHDGSQTAANCSIYLNGVLGTVALSQNGAGGQGSDTAQNLYIGRNVFATSHTHDGLIFLAGCFKRIWTASEVRSFHNNPWQIFKAQARRLWVGASAATGLSGTSTATLADVTTAAAAALQLKAASTVTLADVTTAGATNLAIAAAGSKTLADVTGAATGALLNTGAGAATLADVSSSAAGALQIKASVSQTLANVTASADSDLVITAGGGGQLDNVTLIATGVGAVVNTGASAVTLADVTGSGAATLRLQAASNVTLADVSTAGATTLYLVGASSKTLDDVTSTSTAAGALRNTGAVSITLANVTLSAAGAAEVPRTLLGPRPGGPRSTGNTRPGSTTASRPPASTRTRSTNR